MIVIAKETYVIHHMIVIIFYKVVHVLILQLKCDTAGEYEINLSQTSYYDFFLEFPRAYETR